MQLIVLFPSVCSFFGSFFIIISYLFFLKLRSSTGIFALWFAISGLGNSLYPFLGSPKEDSYLCQLQSIIGTYFLLITFFTSTILSKLLYLIFYNAIFVKIEINIYYIMYAWGLPILLISLPLFTNSYGRDRNNDRFNCYPSFRSFYLCIYLFFYLSFFFLSFNLLLFSYYKMKYMLIYFSFCLFD